eukprot:scaffold1239_cov175-Pinguiococcus_pyrenoidosus.AAC.20
MKLQELDPATSVLHAILSGSPCRSVGGNLASEPLLPLETAFCHQAYPPKRQANLTVFEDRIRRGLCCVLVERPQKFLEPQAARGALHTHRGVAPPKNHFAWVRGLTFAWLQPVQPVTNPALRQLPTFCLLLACRAYCCLLRFACLDSRTHGTASLARCLTLRRACIVRAAACLLLAGLRLATFLLTTRTLLSSALPRRWCIMTYTVQN